MEAYTLKQKIKNRFWKKDLDNPLTPRMLMTILDGIIEEEDEDERIQQDSMNDLGDL